MAHRHSCAAPRCARLLLEIFARHNVNQEIEDVRAQDGGADVAALERAPLVLFAVVPAAERQLRAGAEKQNTRRFSTPRQPDASDWSVGEREGRASGERV